MDASYPYLGDLLHAALGVNVALPLPMFGLFVALAVAIAASVFTQDARRAEAFGRLPVDAHQVASDLTIVTLFAGLVGARLFHVLDHWDDFLQNPGSLIFTRSGFSIYGGLCFGALAGMLLVRWRGLPVVPILDAVAPALMLAYAIGRVGCQVSGDGDWGIPADMTLKPGWLPTWFWAQTYEGNIVEAVLPPPGVYPTPIYETIAALLTFAVLRRWAQRQRPPGNVFFLYLLFTGFERLLIEKIRLNPRFALLDVTVFTQAELISVLLILIGIAGLLKTLPAQRKWLRYGTLLGMLALLSACVAL